MLLQFIVLLVSVLDVLKFRYQKSITFLLYLGILSVTRNFTEMNLCFFFTCGHFSFNFIFFPGYEADSSCTFGPAHPLPHASS
jgi:hypothetical protein